MPITLSQDPSQFSLVRFICLTDDKFLTEASWCPGLGTNRFAVTVANANPVYSQIYLKTRVFEISGRKVNTAMDTTSSGQNWHGGQIALPNGNVAQTDTIKIVRVLGYSL